MYDQEFIYNQVNTYNRDVTLEKNSKRTAIVRKRLSLPLINLLECSDKSWQDTFSEKAKKREFVEVMDFGCGKQDNYDLKNLEYYFRLFLGTPIQASFYDPNNIRYSYLHRKYKYDVVLCNYVICTIPINENLINDLWNITQNNGWIFISSRTRKEIEREASKNNWEPYKHGYITKANTFVAGFNNLDLTNCFERFGKLGLISHTIDISTNKFSAILIHKQGQSNDSKKN